MRKLDTKNIEAYKKLDAELSEQIAQINWQAPGAWDTKWSLLTKINEAYDALTKEERNIYHTGKANPPVFKGDLGRAASAAYGRSRFYRSTIDKDVKGKDLIQPYLKDGKPNLDFVDHYGTKEYPKEIREQLE